MSIGTADKFNHDDACMKALRSNTKKKKNIKKGFERPEVRDEKLCRPEKIVLLKDDFSPR